MTEEDIGKLIDAISEDFSSEEIENDELITEQLKELIGLNETQIRAVLPAVREIKALRGDRQPFWLRCLEQQ